MMHRLMIFALTLFAQTACASSPSTCVRVDIQSVGKVSIQKNILIAPMDGGRGPLGPALGLLLDPAKVHKKRVAVELVRLSLWPSDATASSMKCKQAMLLKKPVISCNVGLKSAGLMLLAQYASNGEDPTSFVDVTKAFVPVVERALLECRSGDQIKGPE